VWPAFARVAVDAGATSVDVFTQSARTLATAANVVRAIDAATAKPETARTMTIVTTAVKQVASIYTNVPNIQLEQPAFNTVIEQNLTLAINDGLDKLMLDYIATAGFQAPGTDQLLVSIRKAMTTIMAGGYSPDLTGHARPVRGRRRHHEPRQRPHGTERGDGGERTAVNRQDRRLVTEKPKPHRNLKPSPSGSPRRFAQAAPPGERPWRRGR
jgi:hypothetical protein